MVDLLKQKQSFYLISNASQETYPENSLVEFRNKLPMTIETDRNEGLEMALSFLGISNNFLNIELPPHGLPSFIVTDCFPSEGKCLTENVSDGNIQNCGLPSDFEYNYELGLGKNIDYYNGQHSSDGVSCKWFSFWFEEKYYSKKDLKTYFDDAEFKIFGVSEGPNKLRLDEDNRLLVEADEGSMFWFMMHKTMVDSFNFTNQLGKIGNGFELVYMDNKKDFHAEKSLRYLWKKYIKDEEYYVYRIEKQDTFNKFIISAPEAKVFERKFPSVIRVLCENISPQIYNSSFSKDLIVFCPDFKSGEEYTSTEFSTKQYVPISNSIIDTFSIKLVDENNKPISLLPGPATIIKMDLRSRFLNKKTFNVRLTSEKNKNFPDNDNASFKVNLPAPIIANRNWRVSLSSISNPNIFSTFLRDEDTRKIFFKELSGRKKYVMVIIPALNRIYTEQDLIEGINSELRNTGLGSLSIEDGKCLFSFFEKDVLIIASNNLLKILGYNGNINENSKVSRIMLTNDVEIPNLKRFKPSDETTQIFLNTEETAYEYSFLSKINLSYLRPNYMIIYSNIVSKSILGGAMSNIIKVVPFKNNNESYTISDFKHKEYYELQNTEIDCIEIQIRSHDGELINFGTTDNTILNLEFSNYLEITR